ncbi:DUF2470 domain-containing protein [Spirillospora sp. CA-294931]|uniref:DUF2470 domain-containing protein n=1 Tax=Spirillospora sp. CA-294931 TaxID=3240042 RepID=UPI003D92938E
MTTLRRPTAGERARTLAYGVADGVLAVPGVPYAPVSAHATDEDGRPLLLVPAESAAVAALRGESDLPATLRISDVAPVALPDRVRGRAWMHGWVAEVAAERRGEAALRISRLHPRPELLDLGDAWTILVLEVAEIEIEDAWGCATLEPEEYQAAVPDPFVAIEAGMLTHLDTCHRGELAQLLKGLRAVADEATRERIGRPGAGPVVRPLALDRYGMWLRCSDAPPAEPDPFDLRVVFSEPVRDIHGLRCVYRRLFATATS